MRTKFGNVKRKFDLNPIYYVYLYFDLSNPGKFIYKNNDIELCFLYEPIYVGKGKNNRAYSHFYGIKNENIKSHFYNKCRKLLKRYDFNSLWIIYKKELSENDALSLEYIVEQCIGRKILDKGPLLNICEGGHINYCESGKSN